MAMRERDVGGRAILDGFFFLTWPGSLSMTRWICLVRRNWLDDRMVGGG